MVAPSNSPVVTSVPLTGPSYLLGEVSNVFQPLKDTTYFASIPGSLVGNEVKAGFACFTTDQINVTRGTSGSTLAQFVGFAELMSFNEYDPGSLTGALTLGDKFSVPVLQIGSIYVYNSTAIVTTVASGLKVVTSITTGTTPSTILVGAVIQGADPSGSTTVDISTVAKVRTANSTVGLGVLIDILVK